MGLRIPQKGMEKGDPKRDAKGACSKEHGEEMILKRRLECREDPLIPGIKKNHGMEGSYEDPMIPWKTPKSRISTCIYYADKYWV